MTRIRSLMVRVLGSLVAIALLMQQSGRAQAPQAADPSTGRTTFAAVTQTAVAESNGMIARMVQAGELATVRIQDDRQIAGREIQTLQQTYKGIPVEGGSVTLQRAGVTAWTPACRHTSRAREHALLASLCPLHRSRRHIWRYGCAQCTAQHARRGRHGIERIRLRRCSERGA